MTGVTDVVSQLGGQANRQIGGGADSQNMECPQRFKQNQNPERPIICHQSFNEFRHIFTY